MDRRSYKGDKCVVKYIGPVPNWTVTAIGVEWDKPERGKNSGDLNGTKYFSTRIDGAGSFVKSTRTPDQPESLYDAIVGKYVQQETNFEELQLSKHKKIETVGVDKIHRRQARIDELNTISLRGSLVNNFFSGDLIFSSLNRIDLSDTLVYDFSAVVRFLVKFPQIKSICLNDNRLNFDAVDTTVCNQVQELELSRTLISPSEIELVLRLFPSLKSLGLAQNRLDSIPSLASLEDLDLSDNLLDSSSILQIQHCHTVILTGNPISSIPAHLQSISSLSITLSSLSTDWVSVDRLSNCSELRLSCTPEERPYIIARLSRLSKLDGTVISKSERQDSEIYTIAAVLKKLHPPLPSDRWNDLVSEHGTPDPPKQGSILARLVILTVDGQPLRIVRDATVRRLILVVARSLQLKVWGLQLIYQGKPLDPHLTVEDYLIDDTLVLETNYIEGPVL